MGVEVKCKYVGGSSGRVGWGSLGMEEMLWGF